MSDVVSARSLGWNVLRRHRTQLALGLLLMLVGRGTALLLPASTKFIFDDVLAGGRSELLLPIALGVLGATIVIAITSYLLTLVLSVTAQRTIAELRLELQRHVLQLPLRYHDGTLTGSLASRILLDPEGITHLLGTGIIQLAGGSVAALLGFGVLLYLNWQLTVGTVIVLAGFAAATTIILLQLRPLLRDRAAYFAELTGRLNELLAGIRVVKVHGSEEREQNSFAAGVARLRDMTATSMLRVSLLSSITAITVGAIGVVIMVLGGRAVLAGNMSPGELLWYATTVAFVARPLQAVANAATQLTQALADLDRVSEIRALEVDASDDTTRERVPFIAGDITFEHVSFIYDAAASESAGLRDVSFHAPAGSVTAIVGPSGAGKSTLLYLLLGLYEPSAGRVLVDGRDLHSLRLSEYRRHVGAVLQDGVLFHGTIRDNIAYARPTATADDVQKAARVAHAAEFIERLPAGYDALVGERGVRLSAGQRQRIALARAILADPRILVLDEVTAHLDPATERSVHQQLASFRDGRTTFIIAHDTSSVRDADQLLVLDRGRVIQQTVRTFASASV